MAKARCGDVRIGDRIRITSDNQNYDRFRNKTWKVTHIACSEKEHRGYDTTVEGQALVDCEGLPLSLYEYEFDIVSSKRRK